MLSYVRVLLWCNDTHNYLVFANSRWVKGYWTADEHCWKGKGKPPSPPREMPIAGSCTGIFLDKPFKHLRAMAGDNRGASWTHLSVRNSPVKKFSCFRRGALDGGVGAATAVDDSRCRHFVILPGQYSCFATVESFWHGSAGWWSRNFLKFSKRIFFSER